MDSNIQRRYGQGQSRQSSIAQTSQPPGGDLTQGVPRHFRYNSLGEEKTALPGMSAPCRPTNPVTFPKRVIPPPQVLPIKRVKVFPHPILSNLRKDLKWESMELGVEAVIVRTFVNDTGDFFAQGLAKFQEAEEMERSIYSFLATGVARKLLSYEATTMCLAQFCEFYYRAEILNPCPDDDTKIQVFFSDYGNIETVLKDELLEIPDELATLPRHVCHCRWNIMLANEMGAVRLNAIFGDEFLTITPKVEVAPGQYIVQLGNYLCNSEFEVPLVHVAPSKTEIPGVTPTPITPVGQQTPGIATPEPAPMPIALTETPVTPTPLPALPSPMPVLSVPATSPTPSSAGKYYTLTARPPLPAKPLRRKYMLERLPHSQSIQPNGEVFVAFTWTRTRYLVVGEDHETEAGKMQALIEQQLQFCEKLADGEVPVVGEVLLAPYEEVYYRGVIKNVSQASKAAFFEFIDFGDRALCNFDDIRIPNEEIMRFPLLGLSVHLPAVNPVSDDEVTGVVPDYLDGKMQMQIFNDEAIRENVNVALWISSSLTLNTVAHKMHVAFK